MPRLDAAALSRHRRRNRLESLLILCGLAAWAALVGWLLAGPEGIVWSALAGSILLFLQPGRSVTLLRTLFGALPLASSAAPDLTRLVADLSQRAGLDHPPALFFIPRRDLVALSTGTGADTAIALSAGILSALSPRELAGVLAHELSHIAAGDLKIMRLAEAAGRLTHTLSLLGVAMMVFTLPAALAMGFDMPLLPILLLVGAPLASDLMSLKLARTREFAADAGAAALIGDPGALIAALERIDRLQGFHWERLVRPPLWLAWLRTHPSTAERLRRLAELAPLPARQWVVIPDFLVLPGLLMPSRRRTIRW